MDEIREYISTMNKLEAALTNLSQKVATTAVNFYKERFVQQNWVDNRTEAWKPRKRRKKEKRPGRAILTDTARLKRDVQKIHVSDKSVLIGTTRLTVPYAKSHNEGFQGVVKVKEHRRRVLTVRKEKYKTRTGRTRSRTVKVVDRSKKPGTVRSHRRKVNLPRRQFMGQSAILDKRIERIITAQFWKALK